MWRVLSLAALLSGGALFFFRSNDDDQGETMLDMSKPRGVRLNNPGNIRHGDPWQGMAPDQPDADFVYFTDPRYGFRAMVRILRSYQRRGVVTLADTIGTWAPPIENNTAAYVAHVSERTGIQPHEPVNLDNRRQLVELLRSMALHENGMAPWPVSTIEQGIELA